MSTARPDYWYPAHFQPGQRVYCGEFLGSVVRHYCDGMWEIRLPGGVVCVSGSDLRSATAHTR